LSALALYLASTIAIVLLWRRVRPLSLMAAIVLILLPLCFTGRALLTGKIYGPVDLPYMSEPLGDYKDDYGVGAVHNGNLSDLYCQIIPWRKAVRWSIAQGEWPLWNPFMLCGDILAQAAQAAPYDPVNLAALLIPMAPSLTYGAAMTFFLAGFFTFAFARLLGLSDLASIVAAAGFMFAALLAFFVGWPLARAWSFLPLVLCGVRLVVHERRIAVLTTGFVLLIFAGHPESILHVVFVGALYGVFELLSSRASVEGSGRVVSDARPSRPDPSTPLGMTLGAAVAAVAAGVLALALTAIFLLPFFEAVPQTVEHHVRKTQYATADVVTVPEVIMKRAAATLFPWFGGGPEGDNYTPLWEPQNARVGALVLALAIVAVVIARRRETWFFLALGLFSLCAALDAPPVAHLLHELPLFDIALNERLAFAAVFAFAMLAGIGMDAIAKRPRAAAITLLAVAAILGAGTWLLWSGQLEAGVRVELLRKLTAAELIPLLIVATLIFRKSRVVAPAILGLLLAQRTIEDGWLYPSLPGHVFYPPVPVLEAIPRETPEPFRIVGAHFSLIPDTAALYELEDVRGYQAMTFGRLAQTYPMWAVPQAISFNAVADLRNPFLSLANVRYALSPNEPNPPEGWRNIVTDRQTSLFENTRVLPRAFVPRRVRYEGQDAKVLEAMKGATDYSDLAWILAPEVGPHEIGNGPGRIALTQKGSTFDITATMAGDGWVVITNSAWKGWRAYLNGKRVNTHYANHAFLGVFVPQGQHHLRLVYLPASFTRGRLISFVTAAGIMLWWAIRAWRTRRATLRTPATSP
jgi:Bacterial membrane protein YfhO